MSTQLSLIPHYSANVTWFGQSVPTNRPKLTCVTEEEFKHDMAVIQYWAEDADANSFYTGMPMQISYGRASQRLFTGYVNHVERVNNRLSTTTSVTERNAVWVYCMGASWWMKTPGFQRYASMTADQIVTQIAGSFGLGVQTVPHSYVWPNLSMTGRSYWEFCVDLAKRIGYTFFCNGTQLIFRPRSIDPLKLSQPVVIYDYKADPFSLPVFHPQLGSSVPEAGQVRYRWTAGIDHRTGQLVQTASYRQLPTPTHLGIANDPSLFSEFQHVAIDTQQRAETLVHGADLNNQMYLRATATAMGNPFVTHGTLLYVKNANGGQNGLWYVERVEHEINPQTYQMDMVLGRDSRGITPAMTLAPTTTTYQAPVLSQGKWLAA